MSQRSELIQTIHDIENGLAMNPTGEILERLTSRLTRAKAKLAGLDEKKSESQPSEKTGQLEQQSRVRPELNPSLGIPSLNETPEKLAADKRLPTKEELQETERGMEKSDEQLEKEWNELPMEEKARQHREFVSDMDKMHRTVIAKIKNPAPITVPVVEMDFKDRDGNTYTRALDQADILSLLKTYFKRVAVSPKMEAKRYSEAYSSGMGKMVYKLFQGWNTIYNETQEGAAWPPMVDCFPGFGRSTLEQKVNAQVLWRWASNDK